MKNRKKKRAASDESIMNNNKIHNVISSMQLPVGALPNSSHFEMNGNREVIIEGSKGIIQYEENIIRVNMGKMITTFFGRHLTIKCFTKDSLIIEGFITSIEFTT